MPLRPLRVCYELSGKDLHILRNAGFSGGGAGIAPQHRVNCGILPAAASLSSPTGEAATPAPKRTLSIVVHGFQVYNTL